MTIGRPRTPGGSDLPITLSIRVPQETADVIEQTAALLGVKPTVFARKVLEDWANRLIEARQNDAIRIANEHLVGADHKKEKK